ncbi:MAG: Smr/MutS family protein [Parvularculaceae bacterium]
MKTRRLAPHEEALWRRVARTVRPAPPAPAATSTKAHNPSSPKPKQAAAPRRPGAAPSDFASARPGDVFSSGDPGLERKARRRRLRPERAIDLHGLTQKKAHAALVRFLSISHTEGRRCVLVVTGKGAGEKIDPFTERAPRGVIRARFRDWVNEPPLRELIARVAPAHPRDGGSGAFYVFLKRRVSRGVS